MFGVFDILMGLAFLAAHLEMSLVRKPRACTIDGVNLRNRLEQEMVLGRVTRLVHIKEEKTLGDIIS